MKTVGLFFAALLLNTVSALHFYLGGDGNEKCFFQDLPMGTVLAARHSAWELEEKTKQWVRPDSLAIQIAIEEVFDNNHRVLTQKLASKGDQVFTALDSGQHRICYRALSGGWFHSAKVKMDIDFAVGDQNSLDSKSEHKINTLIGRIDRINQNFLKIRREQQLTRERESSFRDQSESINSRVVKWTLFQLVVLGCCCAWQLNHLKRFFVKQKLV